MSKRLSRYNTKESILNILPQLVGKKINIVTKDNRVFYIILNKFENELINYQNMRQKRQQMAVEEIAEIIYDY